MGDFQINNPHILDRIQSTQAPQQIGPKKQMQTGEFAKLLESSGIKLSAHARTRLESRNIELNEEDWKRITRGMEKLREKGVRDGAILIDNTALIVSVKNSTMVTAASEDNLKEKVITNIDGVIIV